MPPKNPMREALSWLGRGLGLGAKPHAAGDWAPHRAHTGAERSALVAFHCDDGHDHAGRHHDVILAFNDEAMHQVHDFIQWLFPLPEPSRAFHAAPVMSEDDLAIMRSSPVCQARLAAARARMIEFLAANPDWLEAYDHNHLRITRMIRSTRLIAGHEEADRLRDHFLHRARTDAAKVNPTTLAFWANA